MPALRSRLKLLIPSSDGQSSLQRKAEITGIIDSGEASYYFTEMPKVRDLVGLLEQHGWKLVRTKGSHRQFRNPEKPELGTITVAGHPSVDMPKGTAGAILKQAA